MNTDTKIFLQSKFREYYQTAGIELPPKFNKREWAFVLFDDAYPRLVMRRHKAFSSPNDINNYLETVAPAHAYLSTAYYDYPGATKMTDKVWDGADVIFDLDADQIIKGRIDSYSQMLTEAKNETQKLLTFLIEDFALKEDNIRIIFSGGRGFHVHIREDRLTKLGSHERREVVNYVTGNGLEAEYILAPTKIREHSERPSCWQIRITKWIERYFETLQQMPEQDAIEQLTQLKNVTLRQAKKVITHLDEISRSLNKGSEVPLFIPHALHSSPFWKSAIRKAISDLKVNVDEPVTADVKRLIRLPTSLHGGTGLCVTPIEWQYFDEFDPLCDAVVFGERMTPVRVLSNTITEIKHEKMIIDEQQLELPEHTAVYLMARGLAEYEPRRSKSYTKQ